MGRTRGSKNKPQQPPEVRLSDEDKLAIIADLLLELAYDDLEEEEEEGVTSCKTM